MKFGNYNITTTPKERSRKFDLFRFSKIKSTTNNFVDRFQSKIETFRRLKSRSESPLSFRASLFERDGVGLFPRPVYEKFSPKDFPKSHYRGDNFYVFGNTIRKLSDNQKSISGKNSFLSEHFYCTLRKVAGDEQQPTSITNTNSNTATSLNANTNTNTIKKTNTNSNQNTNTNTKTKSKSKSKNRLSAASTGNKNNSVNTKTLTIDKKFSTKSRHCDATEQSSSGIGSYVEKDIDLSHVNKSVLNQRYTNSLKDMLDSVSYLDEDTEFKVLKDYFETNSYSDIVKDTAFKDYLNKKNYNDILDYLNEEPASTVNDTMILKSQPHYENDMPTGFYENATDNSKLYRWKSTGNLYESLTSYNNNHNHSFNPNHVLGNPCFDGFKTVDRLETSTYRRQRKPPTYIGSTTSLNRRTNSKILQKQREKDREQEWRYFNTSMTLSPDKFASQTLNSSKRNHEFKRSASDNVFTSSLPKQNNHYEDVKLFCELFLDEHYTFNSKWSKFDTSTLAKKYTERQYKKLINKFIKSKGYSTAEEYVQMKFGAILDRSIPKSAAMKSEKLDLPKTYIDNVQRRYHVTKQHFLAAERMRNESAAPSQAQHDHFHGHHHHHHHRHHNYGQTTNAKLSKSCSFDCRSALDHCTGGCMTTGRRKHKDFAMSSSTGSLPSLFRSQANRDEMFGRQYLDNSNCDIYCSSCMLNSLQQIPCRNDYLNVSNSQYDFSYHPNKLHSSREDNHTLQRTNGRRRFQQQPESMSRAPSRTYNRHNEYNHLHPSSTLCSNYVNFRKLLFLSFY